MTIKERVQADRIAAFKARNSELNTLLGTVIGEMDRISKTPSDIESLKIIKKMVESSSNPADAKTLEAYLPVMMSEDDLKNEITLFCNKEDISQKKDMGKVMKYLKETFDGKYDGKIASICVNSILK